RACPLCQKRGRRRRDFIHARSAGESVLPHDDSRQRRDVGGDAASAGLTSWKRQRRSLSQPRYCTTSASGVTSAVSISISSKKTSCINSQRSPTASRGTITRNASVASRQVAYTQWLVLTPVTISVSTPRPVSISSKLVHLNAEA